MLNAQTAKSGHTYTTTNPTLGYETPRGYGLVGGAPSMAGAIAGRITETWPSFYTITFL